MKDSLTLLLEIVIIVAAYPLWLVLYLPLLLTYEYDSEKKHRHSCAGRIIIGLFIFIIGLCCNVCFIPMALAATIAFLVGLPFWLLF